MDRGVPWRNIAIMVALATALFSGLGVMIQWRFDVLQAQLADRMTLFQREMNLVHQRLDRLEESRT
jgi:hypothetical protein